MKIRLFIVPASILDEVRRDAEVLRSAVNTGDMDGVDAATAKLVELTTECPTIDLTEEAWRDFLREIRSKKPGFEANYLLPGDVFSEILPDVEPGDWVLELPVDDESGREDSHV
jgi:hypothetical protein